MGGVLILFAVLLSTFLWANIANGYVWIVMFVTVAFGLIGFTDDYLKFLRGHAKGLSVTQKLLVQGMGRMGTFHANLSREYGTQVVGGVAPGRGG